MLTCSEDVMKGREAFVATSGPDDNKYNTLVLSGIELVIPLEADLDADPNTRDSIKLVSQDGAYECVLTVGDTEVVKDGENPLYFYHFHFVPPGFYRVEVKIGEEWVPIISDLQVNQEGVFLNNVSFEGKIDSDSLGKPEKEVEPDVFEYL